VSETKFVIDVNEATLFSTIGVGWVDKNFLRSEIVGCTSSWTTR